MGDQAKYVATTYLPAVANLKQSFNQQGTSLTDALNSINQNEDQYAQTLRQSELDREEAAREAATSAAANAPDNSWMSALLGASQTPTTPTSAATSPTTPSVDPIHQQAYNAVRSILSSNNPSWIVKNFTGINKSAANGNSLDKLKLQLIQQLAPQFLTSKNYSNSHLGYLKQFAPSLFSNGVSANALGNGGQLSF